MASLDIDHHNSHILRSITNKPPKHHTMKIMSFSRLKSIDRYESTEFEAGGHKWKLVLFPNGNKTCNVDDHISLYLEMCGDKTIDPGCIVTVDYKFFLLNRRSKNYMVLEDANKEVKKYCIFQTIVGGLAGFDRFIPLEDFSDASNGYLIDDTCKFGAEVFVSERKRKSAGELHEYINLYTVAYKHVWTVPNFSKLNVECLYSKPFTAGDQKYCMWRIQLYPKGRYIAKGSGYLSIFLELFEPNTYLPTGSKLLVELTLRIVDQIHGKHFYLQDERWFSHKNYALGGYKFITREANARLLKYDSCIFEVEITIRRIIIP